MISMSLRLSSFIASDYKCTDQLNQRVPTEYKPVNP